jgi:hypothetical protein
MMMRPFVTTPALEGKNMDNAPLYCLECDWEMQYEVDMVRRYPEPPVVVKHGMDPAVRAEGRERLRLYQLSIAAPRAPRPEAPPIEADAYALQLAQLTASKGRRTA